MPNGNSEDNSKGCAYCGHDMPKAAPFCSTCSKYQSWWRNWLPYLGGLAAALTIVGSGFLYVKTTWDAIKAEEEARRLATSRQQSEIIVAAFDGFHRGVSHLATGFREKLDFTARISFERQVDQVLGGEVHLTLGPGCRVTAEQRCNLLTMSPDGIRLPLVLTAVDSSSNLIHLLDALQGYAQGLALLARGPEHCPMFFGSQPTILTSLVPASSQADIDEVVSESRTCEFVAEDELARAQRTLHNLFMALALAEPSIQELVANLERAQFFGDDMFKIQALNRLDAAMQRYDEQQSREALEALQAALTLIQTSFDASTDNPVQDLAVVHGRLQALLADLQASSGETVLSANVSDFEQKAADWCESVRKATGSSLGACRPSD